MFPKAAPVGTNAEGKPVYDVKMHCTCPDWARPCKHLVAVMLLLGEEVARHPAALLALRGIEVEDLVPEDDAAASGEAIVMFDSAAASGAGDAAPLVRRLGAVPYWRGAARCQDALARIYSRVRPVAIDAAAGRSVDLRTD